METLNQNEFLKAVLEEAAWKEISGSRALSMSTLEEFKNKLDWTEVSTNGDILWTLEGLRKFAKYLNWSKFSERCPKGLICEAVLNEFINFWDWKELSGRPEFANNWALIEKFADKLDWETICNNYNLSRYTDFFEKFHDYIPMSKLSNSRLWYEMVDERADAILSEIAGVK
jgi:hypothetical protein